MTNLQQQTQQTMDLPELKKPAIWSRKTLRLFLRDIAGFLKLPPTQNVWQWAGENVFLSADVTPEPGFYNPDRIPSQTRLQEWMTNPRVNDIIGCTAAQLIKTTAMNNGVAFFIKADPSSILVVYPVIDDAKDWVANKFMPMVRSSEALRGLIPDTTERTTGQTSTEKHFPGGRIKAIGANSPAALRGRSFRIVIQDDLDGFKNTPEGDPSDLADRRAATQPRALRMKFSTPTLKGSSRIWSWLEQSTFDELFCPCPHCDHAQTLVWEQMTWEDGKPETARYKCVSCSGLWDDRQRYQAVMEGCRRDLWQSRNPNSRIKGMHMNGLYRLMGEKNSMAGFMEEWVRDYLLAKAKGEKSYQVWVNTFLALCYEPASSTIEPAPLYARREHYRPWEMLPEPALILAAGVDVQGNRLECEVRAIGLGQESWGVEYREFAGDPTEQLVWTKLDTFLAQTYNHPIRGNLRISQCFIDAGGSKQSETYVFTETRGHRGIYACRGAKDLNAPLLSAMRKAGYNQVPFYLVGTQAIKDTLHSRLLMKAPEPGQPAPGYFHFPVSDDYDQDYFKKLTAENKVMATKGVNVGKMMWVAPQGARNEPWDINVYIVAAIEAGGFSERQLRIIARDNANRKAQMLLPPAPPSQAMTKLDALKAPPAPLPSLSMAELKSMQDPAGVIPLPESQNGPSGSQTGGPESKNPPSVPQKAPSVPKPADPTAPGNTPISAAVEPAQKRLPWKIWGKGRDQMGQDYSNWGR